MATYTQILYHLVYSTKNRRPCLTSGRRRDFYHCLWGILGRNNCHAYRIGGVEDHIHIVMDLHPSIALANLVKDLKLAGNAWIAASGAFPGFEGWQEGYGAFTASIRERKRLVDYVTNQEEHHRVLSYTDELKRLLKEAGIDYDERFLA